MSNFVQLHNSYFPYYSTRKAYDFPYYSIRKVKAGKFNFGQTQYFRFYRNKESKKKEM